MPKNLESETQDVQSARFIEAARELGCDESPGAFEAAVKKVARHKSREEEERDSANQIDETHPSKLDR